MYADTYLLLRVLVSAVIEAEENVLDDVGEIRVEAGRAGPDTQHLRYRHIGQYVQQTQHRSSERELLVPTLHLLQLRLRENRERFREWKQTNNRCPLQGRTYRVLD